MMVMISTAAARARRRPLRGIIMMLGVAAGTGAVVFGSIAPRLAGDATVRRTIERLDPAERSVSLAVAGENLDAEQVDQLDRQVRRTLGSIELGAVRRTVLFRSVALSDGRVVRVVGISELPTGVESVQGRLPAECSPGSNGCEVTVLGRLGPGEFTSLTTALRTEFGLGLVGESRRIDPLIAAGAFAPLPGEIVLVGGVGVQQAPGLRSIRSSLGWSAALDTGDLTTGGVPRLRRIVAQLSNVAEQFQFTVTAPDGQLLDAAFRARASTSRAALPAAQAATLVALFVVIAALAQRRDHRAARSLLRSRGAGARALAVLALADVAWPVVTGTLAGVAAGVGGGIWRARADGLAWSRAVHAAVALGAIGVVVVAAVAMWVTAAVLVASEERVRRAAVFGRDSRASGDTPRRLDALDLAGIVAAAIAVVAASRGSAGAAGLARDGDPLLALLPLLATVVGAAIAVRVIPAAVALVRRVLPARWYRARLAVSPLVRRRTMPLAALGLLTGAVISGVFALGYRSALERGARNDAAFAVPLDVVLDVGPSLVRPNELRPSAGWPSLSADAYASDVVRRGGSLRQTGIAAETVELLGLDAAVLPALHGWSDAWGASRRELADAIAPARRTAIEGVALPAEAAAIHLDSAGDLSNISVSFVLQRPDGLWREREVDPDLTQQGDLTLPLADDERGSMIVGIRIGANRFYAARIEHNVSEGKSTFVESLDTSLWFGALSVRPAKGSAAGADELAVDWSSWASDQTSVRATAEQRGGHSGLAVKVSLQGSSGLIEPRALRAQPPLRAVVDRRTAGAAVGGRVEIQVAGGSVTLDVVDVVDAMPGSTGRRFALVDGRELSLALDVRQPGTGAANEVWLGGRTASSRRDLERVSAEPRFAPLRRAVRTTLVEDALSDPLAVSARTAFLVGALVAALLGIAAIAIAVLGDTADDRALFQSLAFEGVPSGRLRAIAGWRGALLVIGAIPIGIVVGQFLLRNVARVIAVTATARPPRVPLASSMPWSLVLPAVAAVLLLGALVGRAASRPAGRVADSDLMRQSA